ncbi:MAG: hypothetical protein QOJ64_3200 [Acidobacteriota bacterium]|jgi:hypothetical protein|nr:hypothetical protein [Acidobacteriota bacterium]
MYYNGLRRRSCYLPTLLLSLFLFAMPRVWLEAHGQASPQRSPAETVSEFYKTMREKRFREAFALTIYKPALEGLTDAEFEELRPDFEKMAGAIPEKIEVSGAQTSGDGATVFVKIADADKTAQPEPVGLIRDSGGAWIIGDRDNAEVVKTAGKRFFFEARIETHHNEVQSMLQRISLAQIAYASQHDNRFSGLPALIAAGLVPKDIETPDTTGYKFHVTLANDGKSWTAGAEPVRYGRSGRLSYLLDSSGIRSADVGGKPLILPEAKN